MDADVVIVGAGPAGLCMARALSGRQLKILVVEQQTQASIEQPAFDGREIALTQKSAELMKALGLWERIDASAIAPLRDAKVMDGPSTYAMVIGHELGKRTELGWLVSNHLIRQAAFDSMQQAQKDHGDITLLTGVKVTDVRSDADGGTVTLEDGQVLRARLIVAADSRFSTTRRMMGISAHMHDFGKNMLVCTMTHDQPHDFTAWEWFDYGQTLALLPMNPDPVTGLHRASVVITLPSQQTEQLMQMDAQEFGRNVSRRFQNRVGAMQLSSTRHAYPLVAVYPDRLVATRFATVGDAAVGMHPVTAHGFNFGLLGVDALVKEIEVALRRGEDIGNPMLLQRYERKQRRSTVPLFWMTRLIVEIYTRESPPAKLVRQVLLKLGNQVTPFKRSIARSLSGIA